MDHLTDCEDRITDGTSGQLCDDSLGIQTPVGNHQSSGEPTLNQVSAPPPLCHLDLGVIECLPPEIFTELNGIYGGVLVDFVAKHKRENTSATVSHKQANGNIFFLTCLFIADPIYISSSPDGHVGFIYLGARNGGGRPLFNDVVPGNEIAVENEVNFPTYALSSGVMFCQCFMYSVST